MKVTKKVFLLKVILVYMKFVEALNTSRSISFFHKRARPLLRPAGGTRNCCEYSGD